MSFKFQILETFFLGHAKSWSWGREFEKILNFFFYLLTWRIIFRRSKKYLLSITRRTISKDFQLYLKKCSISFFHRDIVVKSQQWFLIAPTSTVRSKSDGSVELFFTVSYWKNINFSDFKILKIHSSKFPNIILKKNYGV